MYIGNSYSQRYHEAKFELGKQTIATVAKKYKINKDLLQLISTEWHHCGPSFRKVFFFDAESIVCRNHEFLGFEPEYDLEKAYYENIFETHFLPILKEMSEDLVKENLTLKKKFKDEYRYPLALLVREWDLFKGIHFEKRSQK